MATMMILLVQQATAGYMIWDTGDSEPSMLPHTESSTPQGAIDIFMLSFPGMTWAQMQALGYEVRETVTP